MTRHVSPAALDFCWESLSAGELPYPLQTRSHGATATERDELRQAALAEAGDLRDWLAVLADAKESVDSVYENTAVLAASDGATAVLAVQSEDDLTLRRVDPVSLASEVVAQLPRHPRGTEQSVTVPETDLRQLSAGGPAGRSATDRQVLGALSAQPKLRAGQLAATARTTMGARHRSAVLSWFDTPSGRYLTYSKDGWLTIAPADVSTLRHHLGELLRSVTAGVNSHRS